MSCRYLAHTRGHVLYHFDVAQSKTYNSAVDLNNKKTSEGKNVSQFSSSKCLFVGDTLFIGGTGMFFEGTAEEMMGEFRKVVRALRQH